MKPEALFLLSLALVVGCAQAPQKTPSDVPTATSPVPDGAAAAPAPARAAGAPLVFEPAPGWAVETPASTMRKAQYRLPRADGDPEDGECVVYHFGDMGGGDVRANVERWCSQFEQPDGRDSRSVLHESERTVAGMEVHEVALSGTYVAETAPGSGVRVNKPGFELRAAILASDHGNYFVKLVGPAATVRKHEAAFRDFIGRVR
jgi:hypothetical protein